MDLQEIIKLQTSNQLDKAEKEFLNLLETEKENSEALKHLGLLYLQKEEFQLARKYLIDSYNLCADELIAQNIALTFYIEKNYKDAAKYFEKTIEKELNYEILDLLMNCYIETDDKISQLKLYERLHKKNPNEIYNIRKIAELNLKLKNHKEAIKYFSQVLRLDPKDCIAHNNIGLALEAEQRYKEAKEHYLCSLKIENDYFANYNLGVIERNERNYKASEKYFLEALKIAPDEKKKNNIYSLALTYLAAKDFENGYKYLKQVRLRELPGTKADWDGKPYPDKVLLVFCECGMGDFIQFSRYFNNLIPLFKKVIAYVPIGLKTLFEQSFPKVEFYTDTIPPHDFSLFLLNAPYDLKLDFDNIPYSNGYLRADEKKVKKYKEEIFNTPEKKIGICWSGGNKWQRNMKNRRIALEHFSQLTNIPNTKFYLVQTDDFYQEVENHPEFINLEPYIKDFSDTAAIMKNLDLLVSIDSSPAHLAGALGVKTLILLPFTSDWRWFDDDTKTSWYDSLNIIRMDPRPNYKELMDKATNFIKTL